MKLRQITISLTVAALMVGTSFGQISALSKQAEWKTGGKLVRDKINEIIGTIGTNGSFVNLTVTGDGTVSSNLLAGSITSQGALISAGVITASNNVAALGDILGDGATDIQGVNGIIADTLLLTNQAAIGGSLDVTGPITNNNLFVMKPASAAFADVRTFTQTVATSYIKLSTTLNVSTVNLSSATDGATLYISNNGTTNLIFRDGTPAYMLQAGDITLGANDTASWIGIGTNWAQTGTSDN